MLADALNKMWSGLGDFTGKIVDVFDNGFNIYMSVQERLNAIKQISAESVTNNPPVVVAPNATTEIDLNKQIQKGINVASFAFIATGILFVLLFVMVLKRKAK